MFCIIKYYCSTNLDTLYTYRVYCYYILGGFTSGEKKSFYGSKGEGVSLGQVRQTDALSSQHLPMMLRCRDKTHLSVSLRCIPKINFDGILVRTATRMVESTSDDDAPLSGRNEAYLSILLLTRSYKVTFNCACLNILTCSSCQLHRK